MVKTLSAMQKTLVRSLGWEDPLEKEMATHFSIFLPGKSHGQRSLRGFLGWHGAMGWQRVGHYLAAKQE